MADFDSETLQQKVQELGLPKFRADQIRRQYFGRLQGDPMKMTDLPEAKRAAVKEVLFPELMQPIRNMEADDGETRKTLWRLHDGTMLESVLMRYPDRATLCISSQAGCGLSLIHI